MERKGYCLGKGECSMFISFTADDDVLHGGGFLKDEVKYNLIHMISGFGDSLLLKTADNSLIYAQSKGYKGWLWISPEINAREKEHLIKGLVERLKDSGLPGIISKPDTAKQFAESFSQQTGRLFHTHLNLEVYECPVVQKPQNVSGHPVQAAAKDTGVIAEFLAGFAEDAFGRKAEPEEMLPTAQSYVQSGRLKLWAVDGTPVSMAIIAHRSARHARINEVFTPRTHRKQGYGSALVSSLSQQLLAENLTPMLYADGNNPVSNKVYQNIGYQHRGQMTDIYFE